MHIAVSEAKGQLLDLVRRAESGEEIVLTRHGEAVVRLVGLGADRSERLAALREARGAAASNPPGPDAAHSQDFLYDEAGLPR
jgi:prevent-host-death family protein